MGARGKRVRRLEDRMVRMVVSTVSRKDAPVKQKNKRFHGTGRGAKRGDSSWLMADSQVKFMFLLTTPYHLAVHFATTKKVLRTRTFTRWN